MRLVVTLMIEIYILCFTDSSTTPVAAEIPVGSSTQGKLINVYYYCYYSCKYYFKVNFSKYYCDIIRKNLERQETNKNEGATERHLPKTDESVVQPMGEHR